MCEEKHLCTDVPHALILNHQLDDFSIAHIDLFTLTVVMQHSLDMSLQEKHKVDENNQTFFLDD